MRKNFKWLTALAVAVAATGCSNEDLMTGHESRPDGAVGVNAYVPTITRGTALNSDTEFQAVENGFDLFAYKTDGSNFMGFAIDGIAFTWQTNAWNYETTTEKVFWEEASGSDVTFYAVSPKLDKMPTGTILNIASSSQTITYTVPTTSSEQVDLMYARTEVLSSSTGDHLTNGITLDFQHALSQIVFSGKIDDADEYISSVKVTAVSLTSVLQSGTYTFPSNKTDAANKFSNTGTWNTSGSTDKQEYSAAFTDNVTEVTISGATATEISKSANALLLIPQEVKDLINVKVSAEITLYSGSTIPIEDKEVALQTEKWDEGYKYTYTLVFSAENLMNPVTVQETKVASWEDATGEDVKIEGESVSLATIAATETQYGDVLLSDGTFAKHDDYVAYVNASSGTPSTAADETSSSSSETLKAVGMVFYKFDESSTTTKAESFSDGTENEFTTGLIVALDELTYEGNPGMYWQKNATNISDVVANYLDVTNTTNGLNLILGQQHTTALRSYNETVSDNNKVIPVLALDEWVKSNPTQNNTSNWYIPSAKELDLLASGDRQIVWGQANSDNIISALNFKLSPLGGTQFDTEHPTSASATDPYATYWSCSEYSDDSDYAYSVAFTDGRVYNGSKATRYRRVRAVCAF